MKWSWATLKPALIHVTLAVALLAVLSFYLGTALIWSRLPGFGDFTKFHVSAQELVSGGNIYRPITLTEAVTGRAPPPGSREVYLHPNLNPPFQTLLLAPLGYLDYQDAFLIWAVLSLLCGTLAGILVGVSMKGVRDKVAGGLVWAILLLAYFPTLTSVRFGQWTLVPFFFLVAAWLAWRAGRTATAGGILGGMAAVKLFFGAFFLLFLARRSWRAAGAFVGVWILCTGVSGFVVGFDSLFRYRNVLRQADWLASTWNASFLGFFTRIFGGAGNVPLLEAPTLGAGLAYGLSALAVVSLVLGSGRERGPGSPRRRWELAFALCIPIMLLISPFGWVYYLSFLLIPFSVLWEASRQFPEGRTLRLLLVAAWLLGSVPSKLIQSEDVAGEFPVVFWGGGAYFYSLLLFWGLAWVVYRSEASNGTVARYASTAPN